MEVEGSHEPYKVGFRIMQKLVEKWIAVGNLPAGSEEIILSF